jgi:hypothetical protein
MKKLICFCGLQLICLAAALWAGAPQTLDLTENWKFKPEPAGEMPNWYFSDFNDADWTVLKAGTRWEDQGFPLVDGFAWYRKEIDVPANWHAQPIWLIFGAVNDAFTLYCNGQLVNEFGDHSLHSVANIPSLANLTPFLKPGGRNVLALRVLDWGGSGGPWQPPCLLTSDPAVIDQFPVLFCEPATDPNQMTVFLNLTSLGRNWERARVDFSFIETGTNQVLFHRAQQLRDSPGVLSEQIDLSQMKRTSPGKILARLENPAGTVIFERSRTIDWNRDPKPKTAPAKILNNFVTELIRQPLAEISQSAIPFENFREGWVFFALEGLAEKIPAKLNQQISVNWRLNPATQTPEAMLYLPPGTHTLQLPKQARGELVIRAIPEIIYSQYPSTPHIEAFGPQDWNFLTRSVLSHVNTLVTSGAPAELTSWRAEGRKWLVHATLPGLSNKISPSTQETYATWAASPGANQSEFSGIIVDEFMLNSREFYEPWTGAVLQLYQNPDFAGKHFYAYCNDLFQNPYLPAFEFSQKLLERGGRFALERYLQLPATEAEAQAMFREEFQHAVLTGSHQLPGLKEHLVICLGYLSDPPETLNRLPHINYKVFVDMQFHFLATQPGFQGLFGIQEYLSSYADEEVLRWAHQLFRHYCIEGRTTRFTTEPYLLPHLNNPDFVDGLTGWQAEPAETGTIRPGTLAGFSWLQGRYPQIATGDQGMIFKRSAHRPNQLRQTLQALVPGEWYSLKMLSADVNQLDLKQRLGLFVEIKTAVFDPPRSFQFVYPSNYAHTFGPYNVDHPAWINYHRLVFRAEKETAELIISDWSGQSKPGGPSGQEIIFNFVEVKPYFRE